MSAYSESLAGSGSEEAAPALSVSHRDRALFAGGLCEHEAKALFARYGIPITQERLVRSADLAVEAMATVSAPVALKIQSRQIPHKTEMQGVILGLQGESAVRAAYAALLDRARIATPTARIDGVLVQKMLSPGHELALGVVQDPDFGSMMIVGMGGIYMEIFNDIVIEPLPIRHERALTMLRRLR